ncbi:NlpC/P60 family protein [Streptomyces sp. NPDC059783]|uniref:C40 family peptidase n=1 Tax=Streptomyces sp. NPDC059783 TaxID=3346944 RepID=UPI0036502491
MSPQTLTKPVTRKKLTPQPTRSRGRHRAPVAPAHRTTTPRRPAGRPARNGSWLWTVTSLIVLLLLSLLAGVLVAVHGPAQSSSGAGSGSPLVLQPDAPAGPRPSEPGTPDTTTPPRAPKKKPKPAVSTVTLKPGDTLYALARTHTTTIRTLQRLNGLGTSTLIYAGHALRVPTTAHPSTAPARSVAAPAPPAAESRKGTGRTARDTVTAYARAQLGKPYVWGGTGPRGFDCSGLVLRAWEKAGVRLPRTTWGQIKAGRATTRSALVPGDLVITSGGGHVQLYIGNGKVIHAPRPGRTVTVAPLSTSGVVAYRHITA